MTESELIHNATETYTQYQTFIENEADVNLHAKIQDAEIKAFATRFSIDELERLITRRDKLDIDTSQFIIKAFRYKSRAAV